jgi:hypothetical protein
MGEAAVRQAREVTTIENKRFMLLIEPLAHLVKYDLYMYGVCWNNISA